MQIMNGALLIMINRKKTVFRHFKILLMGLILILTSWTSKAVCANVWLDEDFDDSLAFNAFDLDSYHGDEPLTKAFKPSEAQGSVVCEGAFNGLYAYRLDRGQRLTANAGQYDHPGIGPFQYYQFALRISERPESPGVIGVFHWNWGEDPEGPPNQSIDIKWQWTGSAVEIIAGGDAPEPVSKTIATLDDPLQWRLITIQIQKDNENTIDPLNGKAVAPGVRIFCSGTEPVLEMPMNPVSKDRFSQDWGFEAVDGAILLNSLDWEGGLTKQDETFSGLRPFDRTAVDAGPRQTPADYPVRVVSGHADPRFDPMLMPRAEGWLGADGASSVRLDSTHVLWLFGDTLLGKINGNKRKMEHFINNTLAIEDISNGVPGSVQFYWKGDEKNPRAFFVPEDGDGYFWPGIGTMIDGELYLFLAMVYHDDSAWGFRGGNTVLVRIENPLDPPLQWRQTMHPLPFSFNAALYLDGQYLYLMGIDDTKDDPPIRRAVLARAPVKALVDGKYDGAFEFWVRGQSGPMWGDEPKNYEPLFDPGVTETCIQYEPQWGLYLCTTYPIISGEVSITTAPVLTGPWSKPVPIYQIPEHHETKSLISYAFKAHPELSRQPGELILTYAVNAFAVMEPVLNDINLYYPRFVRIQLEKNKSN